MNSTFERVLREFAHLGPELISADPPVLLFHSFLSAEEADAFIAHGKGKYTESRGVGVDSEGRMTDVKTEIRTSSHTWCQEAECLDDPLVQRVTARVSDVTRTPPANGEFAQLVYYNSCPEPSHPSCACSRAQGRARARRSGAPTRIGRLGGASPTQQLNHEPQPRIFCLSGHRRSLQQKSE